MLESTDKAPEKRLRLHYLDGLRGIAALYVVFSHIWEMQAEDLPSLWLNVSKIFQYGSFSVSVFIVLSGYCLMLPVSRSQTGYLPSNLLDFFKRRARRILPPYYAALLLSIAMGLLIALLVHFHLFPWDDNRWGHFSYKFSLFDVVLHLLVIHNLTLGDRLYHINGPMWSVATEWQIYFFFPLLLLPIWRRFGLFFVIMIAFAIGLTPHYLLNKLLELACPWYLGLFALGMAAAEIGFSQKEYLIKIRNLFPWGLIATIVSVFALSSPNMGFSLEGWVSESLAGLAAACLIICCTKCVITEKKPIPILQVLQSSWAVALGTFSYSLYLTHVLVLTPLNQYLHSLNISSSTIAVILYTFTTPVSLLLAYAFYLKFERPFMSNFLQKRKVKDVVV